MGDTATVARRTPLQSRSLQTVQRVLDGASTLLGRVPLEEVTTTRMAGEAGISVGALYRFFPDRQAILDAVAVRHVQRFRSVIEEDVMPRVQREISDLENFRPARVLDLVVDAYVEYLDQHGDFRTLSFGRYISAATKEREASPTLGLPGMLKDFMMEHLGVASTPELELALRVVSEAGERLIAYAYEQPTREERGRVIDEMKKMLAGYLFPQ